MSASAPAALNTTGPAREHCIARQLEASTGSETSTLETLTTAVESTTTAPNFTSTSQVSTETDDCDDETTTQSTSTTAHGFTTISESSSIATQSESTLASVSSTAPSQSTRATQPAASTSELSSSASQSEPASSLATDVGSKTTSKGESTTTKTTKAIETTKSTETTEATETIETTENQLPTSLTTPVSIPIYTKAFSYTKVIPTETVTTVTYVTVCSTNPASLTTTYVPVTITYEPCGCDHQTYPPVEMTTITLDLYPGHENGHSSVPSQTQGKPQPGYENGKPSVSIHGSPEPTHNNGTYHPPAQPTLSTSQPGAAVIPSASAPNNKGQEAAPTTLATEAVVTGEGQAAKSTHGLYLSQPAEAPSTPVIASGANRHQLMAWTWMAGIIGLVMVFE
ncbi:hypothetical protein FOWG_16102 [Fusarium oxysporum f. sp. lycopersici MN25]|uniref:Uncharacterized protein n=1 Tax=Fusarium oxysporum Fo47 TaxID=660027 RepID=W9JGK5_FUSOX|nr:hypothetical protein FOZG_15584 [Fusarium oxysporum Fo47]EWZ79776.1 hypothetical protein FOWG_16102 [Fusarium oxysporum f. sp. lycopersici MN25]